MVRLSTWPQGEARDVHTTLGAQVSGLSQAPAEQGKGDSPIQQQPWTGLCTEDDVNTTLLQKQSPVSSSLGKSLPSFKHYSVRIFLESVKAKNIKPSRNVINFVSEYNKIL